MTRLIDADALREKWETEIDLSGNLPLALFSAAMLRACLQDLSEAPTIAPGRCGDCKRYDVTSFCSRWERCSHPDDFCSYFTDRKEQAEAEQSRLAAMTKERDDLLRTMREGGCRDCDDLAKERDSLYDIVKEYGAGNGALKDENAGLTDRIRDLERELAMEEEEARRWEWVATHYRGWDFTGPDKVGDRREQSVRNSGDDEVEWLLARYQPSDREGE